MHVYVFFFGGFHCNFILFSCEVGITFAHFKQTNWCPESGVVSVGTENQWQGPCLSASGMSY